MRPCLLPQQHVQSVDLEVISRLAKWLKNGEKCWLATVVATYGSSPRPEGSLLVANSQGSIVGSLSGGCVEEDLVDKVLSGKVAERGCEFHRYGESDGEAEKFGLPCGGHLDILVEPIVPDEESVSTYSQTLSLLDSRQRVTKLLDVSKNTVSIKQSSQYEPFCFDQRTGTLRQTLGPAYQLFIIGHSMVSEYVAEIAKTLDYHVTLIDPRQEVLDSCGVKNVTLVCDMPDDVVRARADDSHSAIVALSHDPRIDDMGLMGAFDTDAFYIGAMGSDRTSSNRRMRLFDLGIDRFALSRLHAPIGIPIGSKTPPEIAVSVMAEITAEKNRIPKETETPLKSSDTVASY